MANTRGSHRDTPGPTGINEKDPTQPYTLTDTRTVTGGSRQIVGVAIAAAAQAVPVCGKLLNTPPFSKTHTDLGKFSHGNFDVKYRPSTGVLA